MSNTPKFNLPGKTPSPPPGTITGTSPTPFSTKKLTPGLMRAVFQGPETIPANWVITPTADDSVIHARNSVTNNEFEGTRKEFSELIRGG